MTTKEHKTHLLLQKMGWSHWQVDQVLSRSEAESFYYDRQNCPIQDFASAGSVQEEHKTHNSSQIALKLPSTLQFFFHFLSLLNFYHPFSFAEALSPHLKAHLSTLPHPCLWFSTGPLAVSQEDKFIRIIITMLIPEPYLPK